MKAPILILIIFISFQSNAQEKKHIYIDYSYNIIDKKEFTRKINSKLFLIAQSENDTVVFQKLRFKEFYGHLGFQKKEQLNKLFQKRFKIGSDKAWLVYYLDSLPKRDSTKPKINNVNTQRFTVVDEFKRVTIIDLKEYKKLKNAELLFFYGKNKGFPVEEVKMKMYKDKGRILKRVFSDWSKVYHTIIIFRHGDFYASIDFKNYSEIKDFFKQKLYIQRKETWKKEVKKLTNKK